MKSALLLVLPAVVAIGSGAQAPLFTLSATQGCLTRLPIAVAGLPPANPPAPSRLFVSTLAHDDVSTWGIGQPRPRTHRQLGVWYGEGSYQGIILSFFKSVADARASVKPLA